MTRLIDADALKEDIEENSIVLEGVQAIEIDCAKALIDIAPTIDTQTELTIAKSQGYECGFAEGYEEGFAKGKERPTGEWIKHIDNLYPEDSTEECPFCHEEQRLVGNDDNFCPNCGADMRKEANNE